MRTREALEGRPQQQRTRGDYDRALDAFRAVYRRDPRGSHADASMIAVAELLAAEGRLFQDRRISLDAIAQYEALRRQHPSSSYRYSALLTEGEIYDHDLGDRTAARSIFSQFLKQYPQNALAGEARRGLSQSRGQPTGRAFDRDGDGPVNQAGSQPVTSGSHAHHNAVLDAALASQQDPHSGLGQGTRRGPQADKARSARAPLSPSDTTPGANARPQAGVGTLVERDLPSSGAGSASGDGANGARTSSLPVAGTAPENQAARRSIGSPIKRGLNAGHVSETALNATPPPPRSGRLPLITGVRHWSTSVYTRVAIDLDAEVQYEASRVPNPDRIFFDLHGAKLSPELIGKAVAVTDGGYLRRIRAAQFSGDVVRVVLDVSDVSEYSAFFLPNPSRLIIDIHGRAAGSSLLANSSPAEGRSVVAEKTGSKGAAQRGSAVFAATPIAESAVSTPPVPIRRIPPATASGGHPPSVAQTPSVSTIAPAAGSHQPSSKAASSQRPADRLGDIATLDSQPDTVHATRSPTTAPVSASVADTTPAPQPGTVLAPAPDLTSRHAHNSRTESKAARAHGLTPADTPTPAIHASDLPAISPDPARPATAIRAAAPRAAAPTASGERSMVRTLGLKIGRIVVDAGHGGHDSGTLGPGGIEEKDVVLDVALRLGRLLKQRLGADVIYTRDDDTFIPLETRTAIANKAQADLFLSVHANSSPDSSARGVETYYLNFTTSADALEVAARENAVSDQSIHQLSDLVKKITLQDKIAESREFAGDVEQSLYSGLEAGNAGLRDRGVKKAPFVVLIGANMPSILAEISFLTNPDDAHQLHDPEYRQRIAESLYRGVAKYIGSLSGVRLAESASRPTGQ